MLRPAKRIKQPASLSPELKQRIAGIIAKLETNQKRVTVNAVIIESLFTTGGTLAGHDKEIKLIINKRNKVKP